MKKMAALSANTSAKHLTSKSPRGMSKRCKPKKNYSTANRIFSTKTVAVDETTKTNELERITSADVKRCRASVQRVHKLRRETPDTMPRSSSADTMYTMERQNSEIVETKLSSGFKSDRRLLVTDRSSKDPVHPGRGTPTRDIPSRNDTIVPRLNIRNNSTVSKDDIEARKKSASHGQADTKSRYNSARTNLPRNNSTRTDTPRNDSTRTDTPRNNSARTDILRNNSARTDTSRNNSARTDIPRNNSARTNTPRNNLARANTPRNSSAAHGQTRNYSDAHRGGSASLNSANRTRNNSAVYKTEETRESSRAGSPNKIEFEIIKGYRMTTPSVDTSIIDEAHSPRKETQEQQGQSTNGEDNIHDSPRCADRVNLLSRGSSLMIGSGRIRKSNDTETVQLHFDNDDYSNILDHRMDHVRSVTISTNTLRKELKETKLSPRPVEVQLPKTFITKTGSLVLYSDNKVIQDNIRQSRRRSDGKRIEVQGHKMSPGTLVPQAYPYWGKHVNKKISGNTDTRNNAGCTKRDQRDYIGINSRSVNKPYSWDYTVLPAKLINTENQEDIKTVSNLSEAVLSYRSTLPSSQDKYLAVMKQAGDGKTQAERMNKFKAVKMQRLSTWTQEWVSRQGSVTSDGNTIAGKAYKEAETDSVFIENLRKSLQQSLRCHVPANTPSVSSNMHF